MAVGTRTVYKPTNPGWGNAATIAKPGAYQPTNPGWGQNPAYGAQPPRDPQSPPAKQPGAVAAAGGGTPNTTPDPYDFSGDPVLAQIHAIGVRSRQDAQDQALAARKQYAIDYGDAAYARSVLGDEATALAAERNPYSQRASARTTNERQTTALEDSLNKTNLFYSGARGLKLGQQADEYGRALYGIGAQGQQQLGNIQERLLQALTAADERDAGGAQDAANRALQMALTYGIDPGAGVAGAGRPLGEGATAPDWFGGLANVDPAVLLALSKKGR